MACGPVDRRANRADEVILTFVSSDFKSDKVRKPSPKMSALRLRPSKKFRFVLCLVGKEPRLNKFL